jgi:hypothetical protein
MKWRFIFALLAVVLVLGVITATMLGVFGMDIHWRGFH